MDVRHGVREANCCCDWIASTFLPTATFLLFVLRFYIRIAAITGNSETLFSATVTFCVTFSK